MAVLEVLYQLIIEPLKSLICVSFNEIFRMFEAYEYAIVGIGILLAFLLLPLFRPIKTVLFRDNQRCSKKYFAFFDSAIQITISALLQIPFFVACYDFFVSINLSNESAFLFIDNLSKPDGLLTLSSITINVLPVAVFVLFVLMGLLSKRKINLNRMHFAVMAVSYFIALYNKPSGFVMIWIIVGFLLLSFVILLRFVHSSYKTFWILLSGTSIAIFVVCYFLGLIQSTGRRFVFAAAVLACQIPLISCFVGKRFVGNFIKFESDYSFFLILAGCTALLMGLLIPSTVVKSSPTEYLQNGCNPINVLLANLALYVGMLIIWGSVYYNRLSRQGKSGLILLYWITLSTGLLNFFFFNKNGIMNPNMTYWSGFESWDLTQIAINAFLLVAVIAAFFFLLRSFSDYIKSISIVLLVAFGALSVFNLYETIGQLKEYSEIHKDDKTVQSGILELSKEGKNVVFIMLDRSAGGFVPFIFYEKPEIKEQFSGFTYYANSLSYGDTTIIASPAAYGGYEYTPSELNKRSEELLKDKHNESILMLPTVFAEQGYSVITCDPPYGNYEAGSDLRIFDVNENISAYNILCSDLYEDFNLDYDMSFDALKYNFAMYSLLKTAPSFLQEFIYDEGNYRRVTDKPISTPFLKSYAELSKLDYLTSITDENRIGSLLMIYNGITHEPTSLQLPDYSISSNVNNVDIETMYRIGPNGEILDLTDELVRNHYYSAVVALQQLGKWFDFLRENNVYDNTRIIILGDHAFSYLQDKSKITSNGHHIESLNPLLLIKDYNEQTFNTSDEFMTIADAPGICVKDIINNPINPYTNVPFSVSLSQKEEKQKVMFAEDYDMDKIYYQNNTFLSEQWYEVEGNVLDVTKWHKITRPYS